MKLEQMALVSRYTQGDTTGLLDFLELVKGDPSMADYRDRHFGARRPGPEWTELPPGHIARPGGFREKRGTAVGPSTAPKPDAALLEEACAEKILALEEAPQQDVVAA